MQRLLPWLLLAACARPPAPQASAPTAAPHEPSRAERIARQLNARETVEADDPRIPFALAGPARRYDAAHLDEQLDDAMFAILNDPAHVRIVRGRLWISDLVRRISTEEFVAKMFRINLTTAESRDILRVQQFSAHHGRASLPKVQ